MMRNLLCRAGMLALLAFLGQGLAWAGDIRHDVPDIQYTTLANLPVFDTIAVSNVAPPSSATLISRNWLLTAAHFNPTAVTFHFGRPNQVTYNVVQSVTHPNWTGQVENGFDFRLVRIDGDPLADGVVDHVSNIYTGNPLNQQLTNVGYGQTGTGLTGFIPGSEGTKRAGQMVPRAFFIEGNNDVTASTIRTTPPTSILLADFINPTTGFSPLLTILNGTTTNVAAQPLEYMIGPFDSGSPAFVDDGGILKIAGVGSFIITQNTGPPQGIYGDISGFGNVSSVADWISSVAAVPEPSTIVLSVIGLGGVVAFGYRRSRRRRKDVIIEPVE